MITYHPNRRAYLYEGWRTDPVPLYRHGGGGQTIYTFPSVVTMFDRVTQDLKDQGIVHIDLQPGDMTRYMITAAELSFNGICNPPQDFDSIMLYCENLDQPLLVSTLDHPHPNEDPWLFPRVQFLKGLGDPSEKNRIAIDICHKHTAMVMRLVYLEIRSRMIEDIPIGGFHEAFPGYITWKALHERHVSRKG